MKMAKPSNDQTFVCTIVANLQNIEKFALN